ncbi:MULTISPECIES: helix-turn-helix transcriptional regulator [Giesbergeria]|uniref:AlpA family phage regulatory protein n=1 Tax=Giesbergeria sinuosa TaxID=80883 RepID=A0ABV9QG68_9BURK
MAILRIDGVRTCTGHRSKTSIYNAVRAGLLTKPVPIGQRVVGWPDYEIEILVSAQVAGQTPDQIRELVQQLHAQRAERFKALLMPAQTTSASPVPANVVQLVGAAA